MKQKTTHQENLIALKRIEGQIRGIQKMVADKKYCVDIIIQIQAAINALYRVNEKIFSKHLKGCVADSFKSRSRKEKEEKAEEIIDLVQRMQKLK